MTSLESLLMVSVPLAVGIYLAFKHPGRVLKKFHLLMLCLVVYSAIWLLLVGDFWVPFSVGTVIGALIGGLFLLIQNFAHVVAGLLIGFVANRIWARQHVVGTKG
jgi:hypothetical protein